MSVEVERSSVPARVMDEVTQSNLPPSLEIPPPLPLLDTTTLDIPPPPFIDSDINTLPTNIDINIDLLPPPLVENSDDERERVEKEKQIKAAITIQKVQRGHEARKQYKTLRKENEWWIQASRVKTERLSCDTTKEKGALARKGRRPPTRGYKVPMGAETKRERIINDDQASELTSETSEENPPSPAPLQHATSKSRPGMGMGPMINLGEVKLKSGAPLNSQRLSMMPVPVMIDVKLKPSATRKENPPPSHNNNNTNSGGGLPFPVKLKPTGNRPVSTPEETLQANNKTQTQAQTTTATATTTTTTTSPSTTETNTTQAPTPPKKLDTNNDSISLALLLPPIIAKDISPISSPTPTPPSPSLDNKSPLSSSSSSSSSPSSSSLSPVELKKQKEKEEKERKAREKEEKKQREKEEKERKKKEKEDKKKLEKEEKERQKREREEKKRLEKEEKEKKKVGK